VMKAEPLIRWLEEIQTPKSRVILTAPAGTRLTQNKVKELSKEEHLIIICGHYEGVDERVKTLVDEELSIGDYVLTGGELPAMVLVDAICRYIPGVVKESDSVENDSFSDGLLEYPHYTRPDDFEGSKVPEVLLNGNHEEIRKWRRKNSLETTLLKRPELLEGSIITSEDMRLLKAVILGEK